MITRVFAVGFQKSDVIPSLPKPKSSVSPKLGRNTPTNQVETKTSDISADLLGLDTKQETKPPNNDDIFSSFFSAPQEKPAEKPAEVKPDLKTEEENFFKQPAPTEKEKSKLTKDSILALYSQTPANTLANQFNQVQPQPGNTLANQFNPVPSQPGLAMANQFTVPPQQSNTLTNQFNPVQPQTGNLGNQFNPVQSQSGAFGFGQVYQPPPPAAFNNMSMPNGMQSFNQFPPMANQFQPFQNQISQPIPQQAFPQNQQFFNAQQAPLSQQFSGLNLGQGFNAFPQNPNVASNTWQ